MRSITPATAILGEALLQAFARSLRDQDLSPVTVRDYLHDLGRFRIWIEEGQGGGQASRESLLGRMTAVDLVNYRQHLLRVERLQATTINRKIQALKKLFGWARQKGYLKSDVSKFLASYPYHIEPKATTPCLSNGNGPKTESVFVANWHAR